MLIAHECMLSVNVEFTAAIVANVVYLICPSQIYILLLLKHGVCQTEAVNLKMKSQRDAKAYISQHKQWEIDRTLSIWNSKT